MQYDDDIVLASIFYLLIGGKDIMGVFNYDYEQLPERLLANDAMFPIQDEQNLPESVKFYNTIILKFFRSQSLLFKSRQRDSCF